MKKIVSILFFLMLFSLFAFGQQPAEKKAQDMGTATKEGYTNETYKINFKLPQNNWMLAKNKIALLETNGKVAEFWNVDKNIRVAIAIEETQNRVIDIAEKNIADLTYVFRSLKVIEDKTWFRKGPHYVYYQVLEAENIVSERFKIQNYIIIRKDNRDIKISLFIISPLNTYYENRFLIGEIYKNFEVQ